MHTSTDMHTTMIVGDLGNTSLRLGEFPQVPWPADSPDLPQPLRTYAAAWDDLPFQRIKQWLAESPCSSPRRWRLGSVNRAALASMLDWIASRQEPAEVVTFQRLQFPIQVAEPARVGIDRLAACYAANRLRKPHQSAIVIDIGTAITIDGVTPAGAFVGGAIAPGMKLALKSLHAGTDQLPDVTLTSTPPILGNHTRQAIQAGVYWMTVHGLRGMIDSLQHELAAPAVVVGTGGALQLLLPHLPSTLRFYPDLVLSGLALAHHE